MVAIEAKTTYDLEQVNKLRMPNDATSRRYSFVTIGFGGDAGLLQLQARSMKLFCPADVVEEIVIVDNSSSLSNSWQQKVVGQYGHLADAVKIVPADSIACIPADTHGWFAQQILKIMVAKVIRSERYLIMDAKNHLIKGLTREYLETPAGRPRMSGHSYADHPMREFLERTLEYLHIEAQAHIGWFPRTDTPFTAVTSETSDLVSHIEKAEKRMFAEAFLDKRLSEFFLYSGFLISRGSLWKVYERSDMQEAQIWPESAQESGCAKAIQAAGQTLCPFLTVHRRAIEAMGSKGKQVLARFWHERRLFASVNDGIRFLRDPNRSYQDCSGRVTSWPFSAVVSRVRPHPPELHRSSLDGS